MGASRVQLQMPNVLSSDFDGLPVDALRLRTSVYHPFTSPAPVLVHERPDNLDHRRPGAQRATGQPPGEADGSEAAGPFVRRGIFYVPGGLAIPIFLARVLQDEQHY